MPAHENLWPAFDYASGKGTLDALHMQSQVVGKVKLALTRIEPEWQNVPLWVNARGLTTGLLRAGDSGIEISFDLVHHRLEIRTTDGGRDGFELRPRPLCDFTAEVMGALERLNVRVAINPMTVEVPNPVRCDQFDGYDAYDPVVANRLFRILAQNAPIFEDFRAGFWGKQGAVSFFWGTFDLAVARFNLVAVPASPEMDLIYRVGGDSEQSEFGFWFGSEKYPRPAYYAFTFPKPNGIEKATVRPRAAAWHDVLGEFLLDYDDVRASGDPGSTVLDFANSAYEAGAELSGWDRALLERRPPK